MRVFIDDQGLWYKAKEAKSPSHVERTLVTADFIAALPEDGSGMQVIDVHSKMEKLSALRSGDAKDDTQIDE